MNYIKIEDCIDHGLYQINSRNLTFGVYRAECKGFTGIREKFGNQYLDTEFHFDTGSPFGTVTPQKYLELCPIKDVSEGKLDGQMFKTNKPLFDYLKEKSVA